MRKNFSEDSSQECLPILSAIIPFKVTNTNDACGEAVRSAGLLGTTMGSLADAENLGMSGFGLEIPHTHGSASHKMII
jgi:hypothetical protein